MAGNKRKEVYHRADGVPHRLADIFDGAIKQVADGQRARGERLVATRTTAFVALVRNLNAHGTLDATVLRGKERAEKESSEVGQTLPFNFHVMQDVKDLVVASARRCGNIFVGSVFRLILSALQDDLASAIEAAFADKPIQIPGAKKQRRRAA